MDHEHASRAQRLVEQLTELREAYDRAITAPRLALSMRGNSLFLFEVAESVIALPAVELTETLPAEHLVRAPGGGRRVVGAVTYRQEIVQVLDLRPILGLDSSRAPASGWVLVLRPLQRRTGFLADSLIGLTKVAGAEIEALDQPFHTGHFVLDGRPVTVLSTQQILAERES